MPFLSFTHRWRNWLTGLALGLGAAALGVTSREIHLVELAVFAAAWCYLFTLRPETIRNDAAFLFAGAGFVMAGFIPYAGVTLLYGQTIEPDFFILETRYGLYAHLALIWVCSGYALWVLALIRLVRGSLKARYFRWHEAYRHEPIKDPAHEYYVARED